MAATKTPKTTKAAAPAAQTPKPATPAAQAAPDPAAQAAATKRDHKIIIILAIIAAVIFLVIPAIALTVGGIFLGKKIDEHGVKFDVNKESVNVTDKNGNSFSAGGNQNLPADFPKEVPLVEGNITASGKLAHEGQTGWTVAITTNQTPQQVADSLTKSFSSDGWTTDTNNNNGDSGMIIAKKADLRVNAFYSEKDGKAAVVYTVANGVNE